MQVPREHFVLQTQRAMAYDDRPLPIGSDQTISQPFTVAFMVEALELQGAEKVLEIGTGSGYGAAVLSHLAAEVHTVERIPELAERARKRLADLGYANVHVHQSDGTIGLAKQAPFEAIIVTAGGRSLPPAYLEQLRDDGRIVIPLGKWRTSQTMHRFRLRQGKLSDENLGAFAFVPLIGEQGWQD